MNTLCRCALFSALGMVWGISGPDAGAQPPPMPPGDGPAWSPDPNDGRPRWDGPRRGEGRARRGDRGQSRPGWGGPGLDGRGRGGPWGWFGRGGPPSFSPEEQERFYSRMIERYMGRLSDRYELDEHQRGQVRARLEQLKDEQHAFAREHQQEIERLREQMREYWQSRQPGQGPPFGDPRFQEIQERMQALREMSPLMNPDHVAARVEELLPPDQAARGRERYLQDRQERERRREARRREFEAWREQGGDPAEFWRQQRERWRAERGGQDRPAAEGSPSDENFNPPPGDVAPGHETAGPLPEAAPPADAGTDESDRPRDRRRWSERRRERENRPMEAGPQGSWERYTEDFIRRYELDASQRDTARSVLRDFLGRRRAYEEGMRQDLAAARQIEDASRRERELAALHAPLTRLFEEFKATLDRIPTDGQRMKVEGRRPATRPATGATQPSAGSATLPESS